MVGSAMSHPWNASRGVQRDSLAMVQRPRNRLGGRCGVASAGVAESYDPESN